MGFKVLRVSRGLLVLKDRLDQRDRKVLQGPKGLLVQMG